MQMLLFCSLNDIIGVQFHIQLHGFLYILQRGCADRERLRPAVMPPAHKWTYETAETGGMEPGGRGETLGHEGRRENRGKLGHEGRRENAEWLTPRDYLGYTALRAQTQSIHM